MDDQPTSAPRRAPAHRLGGLNRRAATAIVAGGLLTGGVVGGVVIANAATSTATPSPSGSSGSGTGTAPGGPGRPGDFDPTKGGHTANGITETLLTGDTATKVRNAALAAVPGATIERVETDAEGSPYEAHMVKSDGTHVTVKVGASFKVTNVETDPMGGPHGVPGGQPGA
jgi:hypothetical protein